MKKISDYFTKDDCFAFFTTAVLMFIVHGFSFANVMYSHDSLYFQHLSIVSKIEAGRWMYEILLKIRGIATPWMMGVLSTAYVSLSVVLVARLFEFDRLKSACVAVLFATNAALIPLFCTYCFDADADTLALLMACFAVYALERFQGKKRIIVSILSVILCLTLYQAFICMALGLVLFLMIKKSAACKDNNEVAQVFFMGIKQLLVLAAGAVIYVIHAVTYIKYLGLGMNSGYNSAGKVTAISVKNLLMAIPYAYWKFATRIIKTSIYNNKAGIVAPILAFLLVVISFAGYIKTKREFKGSLKLIVPCLVLIPLFLNAIYLVSFGTMHDIMTYAFYLVYLLPLIFDDMIRDHSEKRGSSKIVVLAVVAIVILGLNSTIFANGAYVHKKLVYDNTLMHAQKIWEDVNCLDGYIEGETPVVFVGNFYDSKAAYKGQLGKKYSENLVGSAGSAITYDDAIKQFYGGILGRGILVDLESPDMSNNAFVKEMNEYPSDGYCNWVGNKVVVKLSDSID